jgi:PAS domain S-box-containing protein
VVGSGVDVTARHLAEQARARSEARLAEAQRLAHVGSWEWDVAQNRVTWSDELYRIYGLDSRTFAANYQAYLERVHPDDRSASHLVIEGALREARPFVYEHRVVRPDGEVRMLDTRGEVFTGAEGKPARMVGSCADVTERWQAERDLARREEELRITNERLRALGARLEAAREEERRLLARELHDQVGQALIVVKLELAMLGRAAAGGSEREIQPRLAGMQRQLDDTLETTRRLSAELRPPLLDEMGLPAVIEARAKELEARSGLAFTLEMPAGEFALDPARALALYRVMQEALTNVVRHANARRVVVRLAMEQDEVVLAIGDDGRGIAPGEPVRPGSFGLLGMRERVTALGGSLTIEGRPAAGTTVTARVPRGG